LKPTFTDAYNNMASALVQKGNMIPAALQCYQSALQINPELVMTDRPASFHLLDSDRG